MIVTRRILKGIRDANPKARIIYIVGNHEFRLRKFLNNMIIKTPSLADIFGLTGIDTDNILEEVLPIREFGIELVDLNKDIAKFTDNFIQLGDLFIGHWNRVNKHSAYTISIPLIPPKTLWQTRV